MCLAPSEITVARLPTRSPASPVRHTAAYQSSPAALAAFLRARVVVSAGHAGSAVAAILATVADRLGRQRFLLLVSLLGNTMVFTHIPSSLLLVTVAFAPTFAVAAVLFLIRAGLADM